MAEPRKGDLVRLERPGRLIEAVVQWVNPRSGSLVLEGHQEPYLPAEWDTVQVVPRG